jgi:hypothetical protein
MHVLSSPETVVVHQLRARWLAAIAQFGPVRAKEEAVVAFMERMGYSRPAAEDLVERAWSMLNLDVHEPTPTIAKTGSAAG